MTAISTPGSVSSMKAACLLVKSLQSIRLNSLRDTHSGPAVPDVRDNGSATILANCAGTVQWPPTGRHRGLKQGAAAD